MKILLAIFSFLVFVGTASADSLWTVDSSGNPTAWDFTDGTHSLTQPNSAGAINLPGTDFFTTAWFVNLSGVGLFIHSQFDGSAFESNDSFSGPGFAEGEQGNPGVWTFKVVGTPEPATGLLVASGLLFVGIMRRKRRKSLDSATWDKLA